jgi:hypothetical protein
MITINADGFRLEIFHNGSSKCIPIETRSCDIRPDRRSPIRLTVSRLPGGLDLDPYDLIMLWITIRIPGLVLCVGLTNGVDAESLAPPPGEPCA